VTVPPIVEVEWLDSQGEMRWQSLKDAMSTAAADDLVHRSVGYLIDDHERYVLLAASHREERLEEPPMVGDVIQIPRVAVVAVHPLAGKAKR
jgi:hypothetical protein